MTYFGGKAKIAPLVWERLGDTPNFVDPFFGSNAFLLCRPHWNPQTGTFDGDKPWRTETVNDANGYIANFWRAVGDDPEAVAGYADWPVNENDLHARHLWLLRQYDGGFVEKLTTDPDFYDAKIAGWWVWGICQWIGSGWCDIDTAAAPSRKLPHLGDNGRGIHAPSRKLPHLGNNGMGGIYGMFARLSARLRNVRVTCGDWSRVLGPSPTTHIGMTAVVLDPPYSAEAGRKSGLYAVDDESVAHDVREWAIERGDDPDLRIALFGYEGEHDMPAGWDCVAWKANGGYSGQNSAGNDNATRERVWFSPHCLKPERPRQLSLLSARGGNPP